MFDQTEILGIVVDSTDIGEHDKRVVLLTGDLGRVVAFARGARKQNSKLLAVTDVFCFGTFFLSEGKNAYHINSVDPIHFFNELRNDYVAACFGTYFLEFATYFIQEGMEARAMMNLLYMALKALSYPELDNELVKMVFEMKMFAYNGEYSEVNNCIFCGTPTSNDTFSFQREGLICKKCAEDRMMGKELVYLTPTVVYTLKFILATNPQKLFTFKLKPGAQSELERFVEDYKQKHLNVEFKSLKVLRELI